MDARTERMFHLARKMAKKSKSSHKLGCVIANRNKVISVGHNDMSKTHPKSNSPFRTLHAEVDALIGLSYLETAGCTAYVFREFKDGRYAMAKPCKACELALIKAGIKRVCYTTDNGWDVVHL